MTTEIFSPQWKQKTERRRDKTCTISGESSPHMCNPRTFLVFAHTISFMKIRSGSPERVAFKGLKFAVKTSTLPYSLTACKNPWNDEHQKANWTCCIYIFTICNTCSSEIPTCPIGGWENTADGTALIKKQITWSESYCSSPLFSRQSTQLSH